MLAFLMLACAAPTGFPIVGVGPDGVQLYAGGQPKEVIPWDQVKGIELSGQLSSENETSPVLRLGTQDNRRLDIASSYAKRMDPKSYGGLYMPISISAPDLTELQETIIRSAGLKPHPKSDKVFIRDKNGSPEPPTEAKIYYKKVGDES